ncbi:uncharacterized protein N7477_005289 [Penicillium maclennaniae]|uniref:uncharacterized protein n=1 Tax=Penicillium maclennaniae TaxID=1343394 RepID=UPI0025419760|nr:uncharacterized protein N7477_005289 [Penicillium maclennaniae]KAJ5669926.1 hypothetical protein N7477_005289 [Penicillium maclennaniae]
MAALTSCPASSLSRSRIAGVAETILKLVPDSKTAMTIVETQVSSLVDTFSGLVDRRCSSYIAPEESELVLAGGLMKNERDREALQQRFDQRGWCFWRVHVIDDVVAAAQRLIIQKRSQTRC